MESIRVLLLCGNRFALQVMQELAFMNQLAAVAVPSHCDEWLEQISSVFQSSVPVIIVERNTCESQLKEAFLNYQANLGLMITFSFKIPPTVFTIPEKGFFNVHPGALPEYRGPDPIFQQIKNREPYAAVSIHNLDASWDSGAIVMRERIALGSTDTHGILSYKLSIVAARLVANLIKVIGFGMSLPARAQDESRAHYYKKQAIKDVSIDWTMSEAVEIVAQINACNPWNKGATTRLGQKILRFAEAAVSEESSTGDPGTIVSFHNNEMLVACKNNTTLCVKIVATEEGIMSAGRLAEFGVLPGQRFECI